MSLSDALRLKDVGAAHAAILGRAPNFQQYLTRLAGVAPYMALDFAGGQYFKDGGQSELASVPGYSFTRASAGYAQTQGGVFLPFASGAPRITDKGILIEGARTNLCLRSQEFDNASWTKSNVTVTADQIAAPDGTLTADKIESSNTISVTLNQSAVVAATSATCSVRAKKGTGATRANTFRLRNSTTATTLLEITVNYDTGAIAYVTGASGAVVRQLADGWLDIALSVSAGITSGDTIRFDVCFSGTATASGDFAYTWGAQLEAAAFPSSYIPTAGSSATRALDLMSFTLSGVSYPVTMFSDFERAVDTGGNETLVQMDSGSNTDRCALWVSGAASDVFQPLMVAGNVTQYSNTVAGALSAGVAYKGASRFNTDDCRGARSGTLNTQDTSATLPATPTTLRMGGDAAPGGLPPFGYIRRAALFTSALADARLQALTA